VKDSISAFKDKFVNLIPSLNSNFVTRLEDTKQKLTDFGINYKNKFL
jgi:hypothetical protein